MSAERKALLVVVLLALGLALSSYYLDFRLPFSGAWFDRQGEDDAPVGFFEAASPAGFVSGWTVDLDFPLRSNYVHIYIDGPAGQGGNLIGVVRANLSRPDVNEALAINGAHGFSFTIPEQYRDGREHQVYAYGINVGSDDNNAELKESPRTVTLLSTQTAQSGSSGGGTPGVQLVGGLEVVYDHSSENCEDVDIPDMPARAFRDSNGTINLIDGHYDTWRSIGDNFSDLVHDCNPVMISERDRNFNNFTYFEWLTAPYRADDGKIYALVHNEWYAHLTDSKCSASNPADGWVNALTLAVSDDDGATYQHPADYIVWKPSVPWSASFSCTKEKSTRYGAFGPSNIFKKDNYYYAYYQSEQDPLERYPWGTCLMRTTRLDRAASWEVWTSIGWNGAIDAACQPIERDKLQKMHESVTYNKYFNAYLMVGGKWGPNPGDSGIFFSLSNDLFNWTNPVRIYTTNSSDLYASFLDHTDTSVNFEGSGREGYIYFTRQNAFLDRDLVRVKVRFSGADTTVPIDIQPTPAPTLTVTPTPRPTATPTPTPTPLLKLTPTPTPSFTPVPHYSPKPKPCFYWWNLFLEGSSIEKSCTF